MRKARTIWLYGIPCSGKTSLAKILKDNMNEHYPTVHLDGDELRQNICKEFGFSLLDRTNNIIRVADICNLLNAQGITTVCSFVTPLRGHRALLSDYIDDIELVYVDCPQKVCMERDVKGHYAKSKSGELKGFTGIDSHFDYPTKVMRVLTNN